MQAPALATLAGRDDEPAPDRLPGGALGRRPAGKYPRDVALVGCQPLDSEDWGGPLTAPVAAQIGPALALARKVLRKWGVEILERPTGEEPAALLENALDAAGYERRPASGA